MRKCLLGELVLIELVRMNDDSVADPETGLGVGNLHDVLAVLVFIENVLPEHFNHTRDLEMGSQSLRWYS